MPTEGGRAGGEEIQLQFSFINFLDQNWSVATPSFFFPNDVMILLVSDNKNDANMGATSLQQQMQEKAKNMLCSISADPILLKRICREMKQMFYQ